MNAVITIGITDSNGRTDILVNRKDRREFYKGDNRAYSRTRAHNNITDASFNRIAKLVAAHGTKSHEYGDLVSYKLN